MRYNKYSEVASMSTATQTPTVTHTDTHTDIHTVQVNTPKRKHTRSSKGPWSKHDPKFNINTSGQNKLYETHLQAEEHKRSLMRDLKNPPQHRQDTTTGVRIEQRRYRQQQAIYVFDIWIPRWLRKLLPNTHVTPILTAAAIRGSLPPIRKRSLAGVAVLPLDPITGKQENGYHVILRFTLEEVMNLREVGFNSGVNTNNGILCTAIMTGLNLRASYFGDPTACRTYPFTDKEITTLLKSQRIAKPPTTEYERKLERYNDIAHVLQEYHPSFSAKWHKAGEPLNEPYKFDRSNNDN